MRDKANESTVINVKVTVTESGGSFNATYFPPIIPVKDHDTLIRFHLDADTPTEIVVDTVTILPLGQTQLSDPEISSNGKKVEVTDKNTVKELFHLNFTYKNKHKSAAETAAIKDSSKADEYPQVDNDPPGARAASICADEYPQVDNDPPG
jgi:hypothetical protein